MPTTLLLPEEEYRQVAERVGKQKDVLAELGRVEITASGVELAKVRVEIAHVQVQIAENERRLDELHLEMAAQAALPPGVPLDLKPFEPETIFIPAGLFLMGSADPAAPAAERPQHTLYLPDFRIGKRPVTVRQYAAFIKDRKVHPHPAGWFNREPPSNRLDAPVSDVSWFDALAYCAWLREQTGRPYTLPSEAEWERACGQSGVEAMLGNVQQWTCSLWGSQPTQPDYDYHNGYHPDDGREITEPADLPAQARLVHRGGSFKSRPEDLRITARGNALPDSKIAWRGFRVAMQIL